MRKGIKILSALLAVLMLCGSMSVAAGALTLYDEKGNPETSSKFESSKVDYSVTIEKNLDSSQFDTPDEKLESMELMWEKNGYRLYVDKISGEVATQKISTGELLFSNPWDLSDASYTAVTEGKKDKTTALSVKKKLMSQIVITYIDNDNPKELYSCIEAAARNQINVEYIKNGIRIEYSIGREEARLLVPQMISKERFEGRLLKELRETVNSDVIVTVNDTDTIMVNGSTKVLKYGDALDAGAKPGDEFGYYDYVIKFIDPNFDMSGAFQLGKASAYGFDYEQFDVQKVAAEYILKDPSAASTDKERSEMISTYPITKKIPVYILNSATAGNTTAQRKIEARIKEYASSYTFEELDQDHEETEYTGTSKSPVLFKVALEYSVDDDGLVVRLPANGIRFDESLYQLESIEMLPYMGAGRNDGDWSDGGDGYTFFPDGSGALFDFQQLNDNKQHEAYAQIYGTDFAYHTITGQLQETIRYPVFGIVEHWTGLRTDYDNVVTDAVLNADGTVKTPAVYGTKEVSEDHGFVAIIEEGDSLAKLTTTHLSSTSIYNAVKMSFTPRPKDSYNMSDAISVGANKTMTVVSSRKYVGNYKVRYIMLSDDKIAEESKVSQYYECSWLGMAVAYRDYLEKNNVLTRLTEDDVDNDIPLFIESYGALMTTEKVLSIPVDMMTPLTTFENVKTMYSELSSDIRTKAEELISGGEANGTNEETAKSFSNINFKLTGFANGGMYSVMPYNLNWEKAVGGSSGFSDLLDYAKENDFGIFPDFNFVYAENLGDFDGVDLKSDAVKTVDNRYTERWYYSSTYQSYIGYWEYAIAPSRFEKFISKLLINYLQYNPTGISVSTLGSDLNSDFDEEDPLNREDSKQYTIEAFKKLYNTLNSDGNRIKIMTEGGNSYTWRYADYILNMSLNSSRYTDSSSAVPFIGVVLHGYVQFAGSPINEEGDVEYAFLKAIENGASLYFILSYQNTQKLKDDGKLSQHYSVRYDIWRDDLVEKYVELNDLLRDLQTKLIIDHEDLIASRVPDASEIEADEEAKRLEEELKAAEEAAAAAKQALADALALRKTPTTQANAAQDLLDKAAAYVKTATKYASVIDAGYVDICVQLARTTEQLLDKATAAQKLAYCENALAEGSAAASSTIENAIKSLAKQEADAVLANVLAGVTDADKKADLTAKVNSAVEALISAAVKAGSDEAAILSGESGTYFSSAEAAAAKEAYAQKIISATVSGLGTKCAELTVAADEADRDLIERVCAAVTDAAINSLDSATATLAYETAKKAYDAAVTTDTLSITTAATQLAKEIEQKQAALAAGVTEADIALAIALMEAKEEAAQKVQATKEYETVFNKNKIDYGTQIALYYNELKSKATALAGTDTATVDAIKVIIAYYEANENAEVGEYKATFLASEAASAESLRKVANEKKAEVDALSATDKAAAEKVLAQLDTAIKNADAGYAKLIEYYNGKTSTHDSYYASGSNYGEYLANLASQTAADEAFSTQEPTAIALAVATAAYTDAETAYNAVASGDTVKTAAEIAALIDAVNKAQTAYDTAKTAYETAKSLYDATGLEQSDYEKKKAAYDTAVNALNDAKADLEDARNGSAHKTEFEAVEAAYNAKLTATDRYNLVGNVKSGVVYFTSARVKAFFGQSDETVDAIRKTADYVLANTESTAATATYKTYMTNVNNAVSSIKSTLTSMQSAVKLAEEATQSLKEKYEQMMASTTATEIEKQSAKQFYESAVENTKLAKDSLANLEGQYSELSKLVYSEALAKVEIFLFGDATASTNNASANSSVISLNDALLTSSEALAATNSAWATMQAAAEEYKKASDALAKLEEVDVNTLSDAELNQHRADTLLNGYKKMVAEATLRSAKASFDDNLQIFKSDKGYSNMTRLYNNAVAAVNKLSDELYYAETLVNLLATDPTASAEDKAAAAEKYAELKVTYDEYAAVIASSEAALAAIRADAANQGFIDAETYALVTSSTTKAQQLLNDTVNGVTEETVEEEDDKYACDSNTVVAVTYGGKDGDDGAAYRTFILNYNSFAITVTYEGVEYTIPAYGYKVINY